MAGQSRATQADVAKLSGVSAKTVSRVFSDRERVAPETVERVLGAAARLRFRPNSLARSLRRGGVTTTVGFVMGELRNPFYYTVAAGIERELAQHGLGLVVSTTDDSAAGEERVVDALLAQRVRALIIVPVADDQSYLEGERHLGTPVIAVDRPARNVVADSVVLDNRVGVREAVASLVALGHRRIAFVCNPASNYTQMERVRGYRDSMALAGVSPTERWERLLDDISIPAEQPVRELLASASPPTAIIAGNNRASLGAVRALRDTTNPPALIGFDDFDAADLLGLSVIAHDPAEMGRAAARLTLDRLANPSGFTTQLVLPTRLIKRGSGERPPL